MAHSDLRSRIRYRYEEFLSGGAGKQLLLLFVLSAAVVLIHTLAAMALSVDLGEGHNTFGERFWFYFARILDAGTMGNDAGTLVRVISTVDTLLGVIVAGLLISSLAGNFQERLEAIKRGGAPVVESGHFLVLGWSEKIYSVIDQLSEAYKEQGRIVVVVMAERDKLDMEEKLADKVVYRDRVKLVVRAGSSLSLTDLSKVALDKARAVVVLVDEADDGEPNRADGRIIKTLMAVYNHPDVKARGTLPVTAEVMLADNQEIASIASGGRAQVIRTNEIISKIILQTSRISGLSLVYDELLRFEGSEVHFASFPECVGRPFGELLLDFPNALLLGTSPSDGSAHTLNPPADYVVKPADQLMLLAEDEHIVYRRYGGPLKLADVTVPVAKPEKPVEQLLVLGWNEKIFPIISEFDNYVGPGSSMTLVNSVSEEERTKLIVDKCRPLANVRLEHVVGEFSNRALMEKLSPQRFETVMVLGDTTGNGGAEEADTRAIIALLLLRDFRQRAGIDKQEVCSEILDPKNRELAATTEIHDIVISNEMVSMVLAQITYDAKVRPVLEDFFSAEGSEIYLKALELYVPLGKAVSFERLVLAAKARGEVAMGVQRYANDPASHYGILLNPADRATPFTPKTGDRLIVLAEDDG